MAPLTLHAPETALVVVDLQHGIVSLPTAPHGAAEVVTNAAALARAMRERGGLVVLVRVTPSADGRDALRPALDPGSPQPSMPSTEGWADLVPELAPAPDDLVITKRQWGAFHGTELDLQ